MISKQDIQHIAKLARLGLTEKEIGKFQRELSKILDYIEELKKVDISKVEPTSHSIGMENVTRNDESLKFKVQSSKLLDLAPETKQGFLKVKSIFK